MLLKKMPFLCFVVALVAMPITTVTSVAQDEKPANEKTDSLVSQKQAPDKSIGETKIKLDRRTDPEYKNSAYSFRFKTQSKEKHKNYVDIVYSANGYLRVNNHGGMESGIVDLGEQVGDGFDIRKIKANQWQKQQIKPVTGHYYTYHVKVQQHRMTVVFRVDQLSESQVGLTAWYQKGKDRWPLTLARRGEAGTSGMSVSRSSAN